MLIMESDPNPVGLAALIFMLSWVLFVTLCWVIRYSLKLYKKMKYRSSIRRFYRSLEETHPVEQK